MLRRNCDCLRNNAAVWRSAWAADRRTEIQLGIAIGAAMAPTRYDLLIAERAARYEF
jgi:hypothetical protein